MPDDLPTALHAEPPAVSGDFARDIAAFAARWRAENAAMHRLLALPAGTPDRTTTLAALRDLGCASRDRFLARHAGAVYDRLTDDRRTFLRARELVERAAALVPGLVPDAADLKAEAALKLGDKAGFEAFRGILLNHVLARPETGRHLCHAMLLPLPGSWEALDRFRRDGRVDLGKATVERRGPAAVVTLRNPAVLNAEDNSTLVPLETAIDVATLDPSSKIAVLRGGPVPHRKHPGRNLFGAGINLTQLYRGRIPFMFYLTRDLGLVNKLYRGLASPEGDPDEVAGGTQEKLWIAAVEGFAIGGHCQILLTTDYNLAAADAYLTLPARKEGIIPGFANLRLPRFVGDRIARQAIFHERRIDCDSETGRLICDEIVAPEAMDAAIDRVVASLIASGVVGAAGNRRAFRVAQEPFDLFRRYAAVYAREQATCHFSPALIANLERHWNAQNRGTA